MPGSKRRHEDQDFAQFHDWFVFRDPEEVFREFFNGTPFDLFDGRPSFFMSFFSLLICNENNCMVLI